MPIANYTTDVPVVRTIAEIQTILVGAGAQSIMIDYEDGVPSGLSFRIMRGRLQMAYKLPCDWKATAHVLRNTQGVTSRLKTDEQAQRVCWRVVRDWLRAQMALIEIGAACLDQIMLPYAITNTGETMYARIAAQEFNQLALPPIP